MSGNINSKSLFNIEKFECLRCYEVKINIRYGQIQRIIPEDVAQDWESLHRKMCIQVACIRRRIRANVAQIPDANASFERTLLRILVHFRKSSRTYPQIVTCDERSRLTRIQHITFLDHEISLTFTVLYLLVTPIAR